MRGQLPRDLAVRHGAKDATARGTALAELEAMETRTSQYNPGNEIPEKNWVYRFAKKYWFNDFGVYDGHDHRVASAPAVLNAAAEKDAAGEQQPAERR